VRCSFSEKSKRRTKTVAGTLEPKWNQTFIYAPMKRSEIKTQSLQMTVYDYDRIGSGEYVGEVRVILVGVEFLCGLRGVVRGLMGPKPRSLTVLGGTKQA